MKEEAVSRQPSAVSQKLAGGSDPLVSGTALGRRFF